MNSTAVASTIHACDPVAVVMENHLIGMQADGYGDLSFEKNGDSVLIRFGGVWARAENCDIALLRLGGALLSDGRLADVFLQRIRGKIPVSH